MIQALKRLYLSLTRRGWHPRDPGLAAFLRASVTSAGVEVDEYRAMTLSTVYAAVRIISETMASLPLPVYVRLENGGKKRDRSHPLSRLLARKPNPECTAFNFREALQAHVLLWGNGYCEIEHDRSGRPLHLWLISPQRVKPMRDPGGKIVYQVDQIGGGQVKIQAENILHVAGLGFDGLVGLSPIGYTRQTIAVGLAAETYGASFFSNNSNPNGVLEHPGELSQEAKDRLRADWDKIHRGPDNAGRVAILEEGLKWQSIGIPPGDAQFLETRKFQVTEIARIFRVPPHMLGDLERATFSNIEQQGIDFGRHTMMPWCCRVEQAINCKLLSEDEQDDYFVEHLLEGLMRGDTASRTAALQTQFLHSVLSADEWREIENRNPLPDGQGERFYVPLNLAPVDQIGGPAPTAGAAATASPAVPTAADLVADVAATALNGAQIKSLLDLVSQATSGMIPVASVEAIIAASFPTLTPAQISAIVGPLAGFEPKTPAADPSPPPPSPPAESEPPAQRGTQPRDGWGRWSSTGGGGPSMAPDTGGNTSGGGGGDGGGNAGDQADNGEPELEEVPTKVRDKREKEFEREHEKLTSKQEKEMAQLEREQQKEVAKLEKERDKITQKLEKKIDKADEDEQWPHEDLPYVPDEYDQFSTDGKSILADDDRFRDDFIAGAKLHERVVELENDVHPEQLYQLEKLHETQHDMLSQSLLSKFKAEDKQNNWDDYEEYYY